MHGASKAAPFVVVECPPRDAEFALRWLAHAAKADRILTRHRQASPAFECGIESLGVLHPVEFSWPALAFVSLWLKDGPAYSLNLFDSELAEPFTYFQAAGFFVLSDQHYRMTQPAKLSPKTIAGAFFRLAETEDEDCCLHPEQLLTTMTEEDALRQVSLIEQTELFARTSNYLEVIH